MVCVEKVHMVVFGKSGLKFQLRTTERHTSMYVTPKKTGLKWSRKSHLLYIIQCTHRLTNILYIASFGIYQTVFFYIQQQGAKRYICIYLYVYLYIFVYIVGASQKRGENSL